jgi:hypothetical protein
MNCCELLCRVFAGDPNLKVELDTIVHAAGKEAALQHTTACAQALDNVPDDDNLADPLLKALRGDDGKMITEVRVKDGFLNLTEMCKSVGKFPNHFFSLESTKAFITELESTAGIPAVEIIHGGKRPGSWGHPELAIKMAAWCSVKFERQVTRLINRYVNGKVTTEESRACAASVQAMAAPAPQTGALVLPSRASARTRLVQLADMASPVTDNPRAIRGTRIQCTLPPGVDYIIRIAIAGVMGIYKYGESADFPERSASHDITFPGCVTVLIVDCGAYRASDIEKTVKKFTKANRVHVGTNGRTQTECFQIELDKEKEYIGALVEAVKIQHGPIIRTIEWGENSETFQPQQLLLTGPPGQQDDMALKIECERTAQERERTQQERERAVLERERTQQERERTLQAQSRDRVRLMELELEMRKLGLSHQPLDRTGGP